MFRLVNRFFFYLSFLFFAGCAPKYSKYIGQYQTTNSNTAPDYNNLFYWAAHPWKKDPSDSVPKPLRKNYSVDSSADVFFIYPTTLTDGKDSSWNAGINDPYINAKTDYSPILYQASVFNEYRLFSPRYRQAHIRSYFTTDTVNAKAAFDTAYGDVKTAFQYYLDHYNHGRPIIIASHSQGSTHAQRLLKDFFENKPLQKQLVVAYVIGMYMPNNKFAGIKTCADSLQTGCVIGWRTFKKDFEPAFVLKEKDTCVVVNPLSWSCSSDYISNAQNEGSVLLKFNKIKRHITDAQIHGGVLWIGKIHLTGGSFIKKKNFHIGDINLFYLNIRTDVKRRVTIFNSNHAA